ncbi:hypothetical protein L195_g056804 [Trifolium pratense]|uniref:Uncharacterized protein n=1 Tax=Trifolium pratense TaxID=57577 RepID=A0A2K3KTH5_TRIPR|nr:hypothetical protein L195_g056804 [Trifolium pratense]
MYDSSIIDKDIAHLLDNNRAIEDLCATNEELEYAAREALFWVPTGYFKWSKDLVDKITIMNNTWLLIAEDQEIEATIPQLEVQLREMNLLRTPCDVSIYMKMATSTLDLKKSQGSVRIVRSHGHHG